MVAAGRIGRGADEERTLVMGVSNRETEASMQSGGQKNQSDGDGGKATWSLAGELLER